MENEQPLVFGGKLSIKDFEKYTLFHSRKLFIVMFVLVFLLVYVLSNGLVVESLSISTIIDITLAAVFGLVGVVVLYGRLYQIARKNYKSESLMKLFQTYTVDESRIIMETEQSKVTYHWSDVRSIHELNDMFLLYVAVRKAMVIPKKYFNNNEDMETFKLFLNKRTNYKP
ncbi:YcxB family protein [Gracilibacillus kekensis]|uniref:YcxB-like protein n=1 Tax=Gracilibacillus kekensis TaxID=1027249 RepID=A0A1M7QAL5_9BACI|nr:YcxB family protein [Gracilibacillus kekensis]SHN27656.1 YcxB-like protein [Gracilibacillus kekensis]